MSDKNRITIEELADQVNCVARNVARILLLLSEEKKRKDDEAVRRRERCW